MPVPDGPPPPLRLSVRTTDARVELAAATTLDQVRLRLGIRDLPLPIPIDRWIETPLGYRFEILDEAEMPQGSLGLARPTMGEMAVSSSLLEHEERFRFTCAHELGHLVLHRATAVELADGELPGPETTNSVEREADRFAAALLMPLGTLNGELAACLTASSLAPACLDLLQGDDVRAIWLWRRCFLPRLCEVYGVSRAAMVYRCREVRLPRGRRLVRPSLIPLLVAPKRILANMALDAILIKDGVPSIQPRKP